MSRTVAAEIVTSTARLASLGEDWSDLWQRSPTASPFQSPAWLIPWWRHFHPGELATIVITAGERLIGLGAFYREDGAYGRRLLPLGMSVSDYLDVLIDPEFEGPAQRTLVRAALGMCGSWQRWELEELPPQATARGIACPDDCREQSTDQSICPVLALPQAVDGLRNLVSRSLRRHMKLAQNRAARLGGFDIQRVSGGNVPAFLRELSRLHRARWESRGEAGVMADERILPFQREAATGFDRIGVARFYLGCVGGSPVAALYTLAHRGRLMGYLSGFDPEHEYESPGALLLWHAIERAIEEGAHEFHFLRGREPYKYDWHPTERINIKRSFVRDG